MDFVTKVNSELTRLNLEPLTEDQVACLLDPIRIEEAAGMLGDLRDRCGVRFLTPQGRSLGGPFSTVFEATACAVSHANREAVVAIDEMATDESRNTGSGNEFYVTGFNGAEAAAALADEASWVALWVSGSERSLTGRET